MHEQANEVRSMSATTPRAAPRARLGEELPVFCEKCGYHLHGLPVQPCSACNVLSLHCPECGHHQPVNTLRPAFQKILGRIRAFLIALMVILRVNFFLWLLVGWAAMGTDWTYQYVPDSRAEGLRIPGPDNAAAVHQVSVLHYELIPTNFEQALGFGIFALGFGLVGRMLLLRWKRGWLVGLVLAALVVGAIIIGGNLASYPSEGAQVQYQSLWGARFAKRLLFTGACVVAAAAIAWPLWVGLVRLFLPSRPAEALLQWQQSAGGPVDRLARE
jgi:hypothetical protein